MVTNENEMKWVLRKRRSEKYIKSVRLLLPVAVHVRGAEGKAVVE